MNKYKKAFTLAETLIALTVLGIIAMIVVPPVIKKHQDMVGRMKIKKAMSVYDTAVSTIYVENDFKTVDQLDSWAEEGGNCDNPIMYFKAQDRDGCIFKLPGGPYLDITKFSNPYVALSKKDLLKAKADGTDGIHSWKFKVSDDKNLGTPRVNDLAFEKARLESELALAQDEETKAEIKANIEELEKLMGFVNGEKKTPSIDSSRPCTNETKSENGNYFLCTLKKSSSEFVIYTDNEKVYSEISCNPSCEPYCEYDCSIIIHTEDPNVIIVNDGASYINNTIKPSAENCVGCGPFKMTTTVINGIERTESINCKDLNGIDCGYDNYKQISIIDKSNNTYKYAYITQKNDTSRCDGYVNSKYLCENEGYTNCKKAASYSYNKGLMCYKEDDKY